MSAVNTPDESHSAVASSAPDALPYFDVAVVGAGIHGAGVAQACAAAGWRTLLLEQYGEAALGTSSKSSKLIHGGLRYLENFEFSLVRECLLERELLLQNAADLVKLKTFLIPVYRSSKRSAFVIYCGLLLYKILTGWRASAIFKWRSASAAKQLYPQIEASNLVALLEYRDAQTDDRKLTEAVLRSAETFGAEVKFDFNLARAEVSGNQYLLYREGENEPYASCRCLINAAGPWVNRVAEKVETKPAQIAVETVQGTHIILDLPAPPACIYCEAPQDGRPVFVLPWYGQTMVGTTEKLFSGDPADVAPSEEEEKYLLEVYNHCMNTAVVANASEEINESHIVERFAGLRVLPMAAGSANKRSRDTLFVECGLKASSANEMPGYLAIYGGKLTAYRKTAEKIQQRLRAVLGDNAGAVSTRDIRL